LVGSLIFIFIPWIKSHSSYVDSGFSYKIQEIEFRPGNHGVPFVKVDTGWYLLRHNEELQMVPYMHVGDSVVKLPGEDKIRVFRRTADGLTVKEFD